MRSFERVRPVDGLRAISVLWLICFHSLWFQGYYLPAERYVRLAASPGLRFFAAGHFGVDVFFVISGFLIASLLFDELDKTGGIAIPRFYARRAWRILPAYFVALLLAIAVIPYDRASAWANFLLINNFVPFDHQFMPWAWSLAIEEQFYLVFPILLLALSVSRSPAPLSRGMKSLSLGARIPFWLSLLALNGLIQWALAARAGFRSLPAPHPWAGSDFGRYFDLLYDKPYTRCGGLICGVIVALLSRKDWMKAPSIALRARAWALAGLAASLLMIMGWIGGFFETRLPTAAYLALDRDLFAAATAYALRFALIAPGHWLSRCLSWSGLRPIAELSYGAYLLNPLVVAALYHLRLPGPAGTPGSVLLCLAAALAITFALAALLHRWVERPLRERGKAWAERLAPARADLIA